MPVRIGRACDNRYGVAILVAAGALLLVNWVQRICPWTRQRIASVTERAAGCDCGARVEQRVANGGSGIDEMSQGPIACPADTVSARVLCVAMLQQPLVMHARTAIVQCVRRLVTIDQTNVITACRPRPPAAATSCLLQPPAAPKLLMCAALSGPASCARLAAPRPSALVSSRQGKR